MIDVTAVDSRVEGEHQVYEVTFSTQTPFVIPFEITVRPMNGTATGEECVCVCVCVCVFVRLCMAEWYVVCGGCRGCHSVCTYISYVLYVDIYQMDKICATLYTPLSIPFHLRVSSVFPCTVTNYKLLCR